MDRAQLRRRLSRAQRGRWERMTPDQRAEHAEKIRQAWAAKPKAEHEAHALASSMRFHKRAKAHREALKRRWASMSEEQRAQLRDRQRATWAAKTPEERQRIFDYQVQRRNEERAARRGLPAPPATPRPRRPRLPTDNPVNLLARRLEAEASLSTPIAATIAELVMGGDLP